MQRFEYFDFVAIACAVTGSSFLLRMQTISHCVSWGQTRPQIAGRMLVSFILRILPRTSPLAKSPMKPGISMPTGQPGMHNGFLHWMQRDASITAVSNE